MGSFPRRQGKGDRGNCDCGMEEGSSSRKRKGLDAPPTAETEEGIVGCSYWELVQPSLEEGISSEYIEANVSDRLGAPNG